MTANELTKHALQPGERVPFRSSNPGRAPARAILRSIDSHGSGRAVSVEGER